jgi:oligopeptidase A
MPGQGGTGGGAFTARGALLLEGAPLSFGKMPAFPAFVQGSLLMTNPLLFLARNPHAFPDFTQITPEHVAPAMSTLLAETRAQIDALTHEGVAATWTDFVAPFSEASDRLGRAWGIAAHMHSVMDSPPWREAYNAMLPEMSRYWAELGQNAGLFRQYKTVMNAPEFADWPAHRQRIVAHEVRDFRLAGAELPDADKPRFKAIQETLSALGARFSENLLDATNAHLEWVEDEALLVGLPADAIEAARLLATEKGGKAPFAFSLHMPSYLPVMQYAEHRPLRAALYRAYGTRASEAGPEALDNSAIMGQILALRDEEARMLGYPHFAACSLVPKMADSVEEVMCFLRELAVKARPFAQRDLDELRAFARDALGLDALEPWDIAFASEKLRQTRYAFSEQEVKDYFQVSRVLEGLFALIESLLDVKIREDQAPVWHPDVRFFAVEREGKAIGHFYLDLYARPSKKGGAWMDSARSRARLSHGLQTPVAYMVCNFPGPVGERPATFRHDDVVTLFHEFGHGLHHLLTQIEDLAVSGINGVEWDAVELPSQFMENFAWEWDVIAAMSAHADTGAALPRALFDKMNKARHFQSGLQTLRQIEFALFDLRLHAELSPEGDTVPTSAILALLEAVRDEVALLRPPSWHRFPHSFSHIFAGGYAAGYYSYKWAEVLSADAFAAFEEACPEGENRVDAATGARFRDEILAVGGSRPAMDSFKAFRGRAPSVEALLRHSGMSDTASCPAI